jgi:ATP-dependent Clp protease adaptor protein ClpS
MEATMVDVRFVPYRHRSLAAGGDDAAGSSEGSLTVEEGPGAAVKPRPTGPRVDRLPPWKVLLHDDSVNEMGYVVETIIELTALNPQLALVRMIEAHKSGVAMLITTHREHAELLQEQFASKGLTVTIEPDR